MPTPEEWQEIYKEKAIREIQKYFRISEIGNITSPFLEGTAARIQHQANQIESYSFRTLLEQIAEAVEKDELQNVRHKFYELEQLQS